MHSSTLLKILSTSAACGSLALSAMLPAAAHAGPPDRTTRSTSRPERTYSAPARVERSYPAPVRVDRTYAAPVREERSYAPVREERSYAAPVRAERSYEAPVRAERSFYTRPEPVVRVYTVPPRVERRRYTAPARVERTYVAPHRVERTYLAPHRVERAYVAPRRVFVRTAPAPFVQRVRVAPRIVVHQRIAPRVAAFVQYVRVNRANMFLRPNRRLVSLRRRTLPIIYRPVYLTGRVVRIVRNRFIVLAPRTGRQVRVFCACTQMRSYEYVTVPATYGNGGYYAYGYSPQYYPQVAQWYTGYYGTPVQYVNGYYVPQGSFNPPTQYGYAPYYSNTPYYRNAPLLGAIPFLGSIPFLGNIPFLNTIAPYLGNASYFGNTPYNQCVTSTDDDNDGDGVCTNQPYYPNGYNGYNGNGYNGYGSAGYGYNPYGYNPAYGMYNSYGLPFGQQQVQGIVVGKTGSLLMVLGTNGMNPILVEASPAFQSGFGVSGPVAVGQMINAFGYYTGNTFIATALE